MTAVTDERLEALEGIALDELVQRAGLMTRVDRKYVLPVGDVRYLLDAVPGDTQVLDIEGRRDFGYRSTYLDTDDHRSFHEAGRRARRRWKVRTRTYLDSGDSFLEVKTRASRSQTVKQRIVHPDVDVDGRLTADGHAFVAGLLGRLVADQLVPVLTTDYRRSTLFLPGSSSRVTIDVDLMWTSLATEQDLARPALAVVETKCGSTPSAVDRLLWSQGHRPVGISKYGVGMAALHPDLPRLKWHHTLDRHLDVPRASAA